MSPIISVTNNKNQQTVFILICAIIFDGADSKQKRERLSVAICYEKKKKHLVKSNVYFSVTGMTFFSETDSRDKKKFMIYLLTRTSSYIKSRVILRNPSPVCPTNITKHKKKLSHRKSFKEILSCTMKKFPYFSKPRNDLMSALQAFRKAAIHSTKWRKKSSKGLLQWA